MHKMSENVCMLTEESRSLPTPESIKEAQKGELGCAEKFCSMDSSLIQDEDGLICSIKGDGINI